MSVMISGTDSATNYIALAEDISSEIIGTESFRIREALTLDDMFGPLNEAGFLGDISFNSADNLIIYAPGTNAQSIAYNYISGSLNLGWRANNRSRTPAGMRSILPYQLIEVKRTLSPTTQAVHFQQQVRDEDLLVPVNSGLNFVGMALADSQLTLANSGIADVLPSAASLRSASSLVKTQPFFIAFHHLNNDWRNAVTFTFTPDEPLISGEGFQINRRPSGTVLWRIFSDL
jgi:hypothetical protein